MKIVQRVLGIVLALVLLGLLMAYSAGFFERRIAPAVTAVPTGGLDAEWLTVETVEEATVERAVGTVRAKDETMVSARIMASVTAVGVRAGDRVEKGDLLIELDDRELQARLAQSRQAVAATKAVRDRAERDFNRIQAIHSRSPGATSKSELDRTQSAFQAAQAEHQRAQRRVDEASTALSYSTLRAPISGRVVNRLADPGDTATPGAPLIRLYDPQNLRLEAHVRESLAVHLKSGQALRARIGALRGEVAVSVDEIVPLADSGSRSFIVKTTLPPGLELYPGMFGRLLVRTGTASTIYVPTAAIARVGQLEFVMVASSSGPVRRYIRTGIRTGERVEVLSGLTAGESILGLLTNAPDAVQ